MDKSQKLALAVISAGIVIGVVIIIVSGGALPTLQQGTFRAAPGKQLESARPIVSETAQEAPAQNSDGGNPAAPGDSSAETREEDAEPIASPVDAGEELSPVDKVILQARNALEPRTGVEQIEELLRTLENLGKASQLYAAKAELHLRFEPPEIEEALLATSEAAKYATDAEERGQAQYLEVVILQQSGNVEEALERAAQAISGDGPASAGALRTALLGATWKRESGDPESAAKAYRDIMRSAAAAAGSVGRPAEDVYRQAGFILVQLLREAGDREEADAVAKEVEEQWARFRKGTGG